MAQAAPYQTSSTATSIAATGTPLSQALLANDAGGGLFDVAIGKRLAHRVCHIHKGLGIAQAQVAFIGQR